MTKKIIFWVIILSIFIGIFFFIDFLKNSTSQELSKNYTNTDTHHNWKLVSEILSKKNYDLIGINPEQYATFTDFLRDLQAYEWVNINLLEDKFWIWILKEDTTIYISFDLQKDIETFQDETNKNLAILDIYQSYKNWLLYWWVNSSGSTRVIFASDYQKHPEAPELRKIFSKKENVFKYVENLENQARLSLPKKELLSYLYDLTWDYKNANKLRTELCPEQDCEKQIQVSVEWKVVDNKWKPVSEVKIELLNDPTISTLSKEDGTYFLTFKIFPFAHLRFKSVKTWYSDWFANYSLDVSNRSHEKIWFDFSIHKPKNTLILTQKDIVTRDEKQYYLFNDEKQSKYYIPVDGLYTIDGKNYSGKEILLYSYYFTKEDDTSNLLQNDTFDDVLWYLGNAMETYGMPYIQILNAADQNLYIKSSNPMILQDQVYHMQELYDNSDQIYQAVTQEDMKFLVEKTKALWWYPIDYDFLVQNNLLRWPARWSLDRTTWIWSNVWHKVLDETGKVELPFFHIQESIKQK